MKSATVITDASFCDDTNAAGWAAWIRVDGISKPIKRSGQFKSDVPTSFHAEMLACMNGLWIAKQYGAQAFLVQTDCLGVVNLFNRKPKGRGTKAFGQLGSHLKDIGIPRAAVTARHVRGHTREPDARSFVNRWCDTEAKRHMRENRSQKGAKQ